LIHFWILAFRPIDFGKKQRPESECWLLKHFLPRFGGAGRKGG
jgi:hypothetical protein